MMLTTHIRVRGDELTIGVRIDGRERPECTERIHVPCPVTQHNRDMAVASLAAEMTARLVAEAMADDD